MFVQNPRQTLVCFKKMQFMLSMQKQLNSFGKTESLEKCQDFFHIGNFGNFIYGISEKLELMNY